MRVCVRDCVCLPDCLSVHLKKATSSDGSKTIFGGFQAMHKFCPPFVHLAMFVSFAMHSGWDAILIAPYAKIFRIVTY